MLTNGHFRKKSVKAKERRVLVTSDELKQHLPLLIIKTTRHFSEHCQYLTPRLRLLLGILYHITHVNHALRPIDNNLQLVFREDLQPFPVQHPVEALYEGRQLSLDCQVHFVVGELVQVRNHVLVGDGDLAAVGDQVALLVEDLVVDGEGQAQVLHVSLVVLELHQVAVDFAVHQTHFLQEV